MTSLIADSLTGLVDGVREVTRRPSDWQATADRTAAALARHLPSGADVLRRLPLVALDPDQVRSELLHVEPDSSFSIVALILRPGQQTVIHDHVTWCAVAMIEGLEREELFSLDEMSGHLIPTGSNTSHPGEISAFAPPGDIHRVSNIGADLSISINVYGTDVSRIGSSVRQTYLNPVG